jgi:hypothetical protein
MLCQRSLDRFEQLQALRFFDVAGAGTAQFPQALWKPHAVEVLVDETASP